jgi:hypothetical protein
VVELGPGRGGRADEFRHRLPQRRRAGQPRCQRIGERGGGQAIAAEPLPVAGDPAGLHHQGFALAHQVGGGRFEDGFHGPARQGAALHQSGQIHRLPGEQADELAQPSAVRPVFRDQGRDGVNRFG